MEIREQVLEVKMIATDLRNSFNPVPKIKQKSGQKRTESSVKSGQIKKKSKKLAKLERQRDKNIVKEGICGFCGKYSKRLDPHEIFGGSNRKRSIKNKFVKLICPECHSNEAIINQLRIDTQREYMKTHTKEEFIRLIGKSYL